jgi:bifunctional non-homologous end joining protein LigD
MAAADHETLPLIAPMLAASGRLPTGPGWAFEFKYDGVRAITYAQDGEVRALSRNGNDVTRSYPELAEVGLLVGRRRAVLDGEIVALEDGDRPSFARLQQRMHNTAPSPALLAQAPVRYYVFDLLHLDGLDVGPLPYPTRRDLLAGLGLTGDHIRVPAHFVDVDGSTMLRAAELAGLEGVVAKNLASPYRPGKRSSDWTKVALIKTQEVLVIGWKAGDGRRTGLPGSLLLAVHNDADRLTFAGHVGTGFTDAMLRQLQQDLAQLASSTPPVSDVPREHARHAHWVEPCLTGEVAFRNWTPDGRLRHASWRGLRTDRSGPVRRTAEPAPARPDTVAGAFQTRDGRWRIEVIQFGPDQFYRLIHGDNVIDGLSVASLDQLLIEAGVDKADLIAVEKQDSSAADMGAA